MLLSQSPRPVKANVGAYYESDRRGSVMRSEYNFGLPQRVKTELRKKLILLKLIALYFMKSYM